MLYVIYFEILLNYMKIMFLDIYVIGYCSVVDIISYIICYKNWMIIILYGM